MVRANDKFIDSFFNGKMLEAIKPLNEAKDALAPEEAERRAELDAVIKSILAIQF